MLTAAQHKALTNLAARGGSFRCDTDLLGGYARSVTHCALLKLGMVEVEVLHRYTRQRRRGNGATSWWQTVSCTDIRISLTAAGRAAIA